MRIVGNDPTLSRQITATASGAISAAGKPLVVNTDGTVKEISVVEQSASVGSAVVLADTMGSNEGSISFDTANNRIIIAYPDGGGSSYGKVVVGTVSGTSISFGTPQVFVSEGTSQMTSAFDTNAGKVAIMYRQGSTSRAIVGTVDSSDNSMSFGSSMEWNSTYSNYQYATFDSTNNKILMVFSDYTSGTNGMAIVGTISGTDITFGSKATFYSGTLFNQTIQFDPSTGKSLITYRKSSDNKPYVRVADASSGSFTYGTEVSVNTTVVGGFSSVYHADEQKMVIFYPSVSGSFYHLDAKVATISGTDVTLGNAVSIDTGNVGDVRAIYDPDSQKIAVVFRDDSATSLELKLCTLSGSTLALSGYTDSGEGTVLDSDDAYYFDVVYDTNADTCVVSYYDNGNSGYGTAVAFQNAFTKETLTTENFIGTSAHSAADGAKVLVNTQGAIDENQSGLTAGQTFFVDKNGDLQLTTNITQGAGTPAVFASGSMIDGDILFDPDSGKMILAYYDSATNKGRYIVATISGTDVTFGTAGQIGSNEYVYYASLAYDTNSDRVVLFYMDDNNHAKAIVGTVSGTTISWGSPVTVLADSTAHHQAIFDPDTNKIVVAFRDQNQVASGNGAKAAVGTVDPSDNSISFGSLVAFDGGMVYSDIAYDTTNNKVVIAYSDEGNSSYGTAIVGTVSGTSISFGTAVVWRSDGANLTEMSFDSNESRVVIAHRGPNSPDNGRAIVGTVSGTSISFGSAADFDSSASTDIAIAFDSNVNKHLII